MKKHARHTNIILTAEFLLSRTCGSTRRLLARDAAAIKQLGMQAFSLHYSVHVKPFCRVFSWRSGDEEQKKSRRLLFFRSNQTSRVCFWQETAAKTKRFSCLDQQGKEEKDTRRKKREKNHSSPPMRAGKYEKHSTQGSDRDWRFFFKRALGYKLHFNAEMLQVCQAVKFMWLAAA